jgi:hypothetical protein
MDPKLTGLPEAIGVLTAWLEAGPGVGPDELVWEEIMAVVEEGDEAQMWLTMGLMKLAGLLLVTLEGSSGTSAKEILQGIASKYTLEP